MNQDKIIKRRDELEEYLKKNYGGTVALAFSGGVDSTVLLYYLSKLNIKTLAVTFSTGLHPVNEIAECKRICNEFHVEHRIVKINELDNDHVLMNTKDRCYYCKKSLFAELCKVAEEEGCKVVMDGTNIDDTKVYRPGLKVLEELKIASPLKELGISKEEVRALAALEGLKYSTKPSAPCMATRIPYNTKLDLEVLKKLDEIENYIKTMGYRNVRCRLHGDIVRLEIDKEIFDKLINDRDRIISFIKGKGFKYVTLDLEGFRSGSMDE